MKYALFLSLAASAYGQEELGELMPDRPGFTFPSGVVGLGVLQSEQGYSFESARQDGSAVNTFSGPQTLLRFGVTESLEIRFATNGYSWGVNAGSLSGQQDYVVSGKMKVLEQGSWQPEVAVIGGLSLPARGSALTSSGYDPLLTLAAYKDLPHGFSVAANGNIASVTDPSGRFCSTGESLWASHKIAGVPVFAEVFRSTIDRVEGSETALDAGVFRGIGKNIQVDLEAGHTVSGARPSWFASMGVVFRDPHRMFHHSLSGE